MNLDDAMNQLRALRAQKPEEYKAVIERIGIDPATDDLSKVDLSTLFSALAAQVPQVSGLIPSELTITTKPYLSPDPYAAIQRTALRFQGGAALSTLIKRTFGLNLDDEISHTRRFTASGAEIPSRLAQAVAQLYHSDNLYEYNEARTLFNERLQVAGLSELATHYEQFTDAVITNNAACIEHRGNAYRALTRLQAELAYLQEFAGVAAERGLCPKEGNLVNATFTANNKALELLGELKRKLPRSVTEHIGAAAPSMESHYPVSSLEALAQERAAKAAAAAPSVAEAPAASANPDMSVVLAMLSGFDVKGSTAAYKNNVDPGISGGKLKALQAELTDGIKVAKKIAAGLGEGKEIKDAKFGPFIGRVRNLNQQMMEKGSNALSQLFDTLVIIQELIKDPTQPVRKPQAAATPTEPVSAVVSAIVPAVVVPDSEPLAETRKVAAASTRPDLSAVRAALDAFGSVNEFVNNIYREFDSGAHGPRLCDQIINGIKLARDIIGRIERGGELSRWDGNNLNQFKVLVDWLITTMESVGGADELKAVREEGSMPGLEKIFALQEKLTTLQEVVTAQVAGRPGRR